MGGAFSVQRLGKNRIQQGRHPPFSVASFEDGEGHIGSNAVLSERLPGNGAFHPTSSRTEFYPTLWPNSSSSKATVQAERIPRDLRFRLVTL